MGVDKNLNKVHYYVHPSSIVETHNIGHGTRIWAFVHILNNVKIGSGCNICDHCFIESGVHIGNDVTIKSGVYIWDGVYVEDNAFLGPNVVFTNDLNPRSKNRNFDLKKISIGYSSSLGANATILAGVTIGRYAMIGSGAVVTRNVPNYALVYGNPARQHGWVGQDGQKLVEHSSKPNIWVSISEDKEYLFVDGELHVLMPSA